MRRLSVRVRLSAPSLAENCTGRCVRPDTAEQIRGCDFSEHSHRVAVCDNLSGGYAIRDGPGPEGRGGCSIPQAARFDSSRQRLMALSSPQKALADKNFFQLYCLSIFWRNDCFSLGCGCKRKELNPQYRGECSKAGDAVSKTACGGFDSQPSLPYISGCLEMVPVRPHKPVDAGSSPAPETRCRVALG